MARHVLVAMVLACLSAFLMGGIVAAQEKTPEQKLAELQRQFDDKLAELHQRGEPLTLAELAPPAVPDDQNAAVLYEQAFKLLGDIPRETETRLNELLPRNGPAPGPEDIAEARKLLEPCAPALDLVRQGTLRPKCRFDLDYGVFAPDIKLPNLSGVQRAGRLLYYESRLEVAQGRPDSAVADCVTGLRLADGLKDEPILISQLVRIAAISLGARGLATVLDQSEPGEAALKEVADALARMDDRGPLVRAMRGERCFGLAVIRQMLDDPAKILESEGGQVGGLKGVWARLTVSAAKPMLLANAVDYVDTMGQIQELAGKPYLESHPALQQLDERITQEHKANRLAHFFTGMLLPALSKASLAYDRSLAGVRNARLAIALRLYRVKHGQYPDALAALVPEFIDRLPIDPFSGKDFLYQREGEGFVVQSVGDDEKTNANWGAVWKCSR